MKTIIVLCCLSVFAFALDNFVAGKFSAVDSVNGNHAPFLIFDGKQQLWDIPPIPEALPLDWTSKDINNVQQLNSGGFVSKTNDNRCASWYSFLGKEPFQKTCLGDEKGVFTKRECLNCQPTDNLYNYRTSKGNIMKVASSGDWVAVCGEFNQIGDQGLEASAVVRMPEEGCPAQTVGTGRRCNFYFGIAVFQANVSSSWTWSWPKKFDANQRPEPWFDDSGAYAAVCSSLIGVGKGGNFLFNIQKTNKIDTMLLKAPTNTWDRFSTQFSFFGSSPLLTGYKTFDDDVFALSTDLCGAPAFPSLCTKKITATGTWSLLTDLRTTEVNDYGLRINSWEPGPDRSIYAGFSNSVPVPNSNPNQRSDNWGRYIFKLNNNVFTKVSSERLSSGVAFPDDNGVFLQTPALRFWYDRAQNYLVVYHANLKYITHNKDGVDPENPVNCTTAATQVNYNNYRTYNTFCEEYWAWRYNNFYAKRVNLVVRLDGTSYKQAYGGGLASLPSGSFTSRVGDQFTYAFGVTWAYQRQARSVAHYQKDDKAKTKFWGPKNLLNGVDEDPARLAESNVHYASFYPKDKKLLFIAGEFRTIDGTEVYSLATVTANGAATMYAGGVYRIQTDVVNGAWNDFRTPGIVEHAVWDGDNSLYIAGTFNWVGSPTGADGIPAHNIAHYDVKKKKWDGMLGGVDGSINDLLLWKGELYVGGVFSKVGNVLSTNVAYWHPKKLLWGTLHYGLNGEVKYLRPGMGGIVAFGAFTDNVWRWTGEDEGWWHIPVRPANDTCVQEYCTPPSSISDVYVLDGVAWMIAGGNLWAYKGTSFQKIDDEYSFYDNNAGKQRQMGVSPNNNLLIWNRRNPTDDTVAQGAAEYDIKKKNFVPTTASFDGNAANGDVVAFTTEIGGQISGAVRFAPIFVFIFSFFAMWL